MASGTVEKRCGCPEGRWPKCPHAAWYLKAFQHHGRTYAPNVTRWAREVLGRDLRTKTEAELVADDLRAAIRAGTYVAAKAYQPPVPAPPSPTLGLTLAVIAEKFTRLCIDADATKRRNSKTNDTAILKRLCAHPTVQGPLGGYAMAAITVDDLIAFRGAQIFAHSTWNKYRTVLGQLWRWARWSGHLEVDLFANTPPALLKRLRRQKAAQRAVRIDDTLFARLLDAAAASRPRLVVLLVALVETGCRIGELLALRWADVDLTQRQLFVRAQEAGAAKTGVGRSIDLSAPLLDLLPTLRPDPAGIDLPRSAYVFGDEYGARITSIDKAWRTIVLKAHGITPGWTAPGDFDAESRAHLRRLDLHLHDLRHEAGNRLLESGCFDLAQIQQRYGHANLSQTSTYLHARSGSLQRAQAEYDARRGTEAVPSRYKVGTNSSRGTLPGQGPQLVQGRKSRGQ